MRRGLFLCSLCCIVLMLLPGAAAADPWKVVFTRELSWQVRVELPLEVSLTPQHHFAARLSLDRGQWRFDEMQWSYEGVQRELQLYFAGPHWSSRDPMRSIHRSSYLSQSLLAVWEEGPLAHALGLNLPAGDGTVMDAWFSHYQQGTSDGSVLLYRSPWQWWQDHWLHQFGILAAAGQNFAHRDWNVRWLLGVHYSFRDQSGQIQHQSSIGGGVGLQWEGQDQQIAAELVYMPKHLRSPLGASPQFPGDRRGWQGDLRWDWDRFSLSLTAAALERSDGSRFYPRQWWELTYNAVPKVSLSWRRSPVPNFIARIEEGPWSLQWNYGDGQVGVMRQFSSDRVRADVTSDGRLRLEWRRRGAVSLHVVGKVRLDGGAGQLYAALSFATGPWTASVAYGRYDQGRMGVNWNTDPLWNVSLSRSF